jgi:excisionase family DNA binding protein
MVDQNLLISIQLFTGGEVAQILRISRAYAYRLMQRGTIPTIRMGRAVRVSRESLLMFIQESTKHEERH